MKTGVQLTRNIGSYNWCNPKEEQAQLHIRLPEWCPLEKKGISATVEPGSKYDYEGDDPWEAVECIESYMNACLYHGGKKDNDTAIAWMRENEDQLRMENRINQIEKNKAKIAELQSENARLESLLSITTA